MGKLSAREIESIRTIASYEFDDKGIQYVGSKQAFIDGYLAGYLYAVKQIDEVLDDDD